MSTLAMKHARANPWPTVALSSNNFSPLLWLKNISCSFNRHRIWEQKRRNNSGTVQTVVKFENTGIHCIKAYLDCFVVSNIIKLHHVRMVITIKVLTTVPIAKWNSTKVRNLVVKPLLAHLLTVRNMNNITSTVLVLEYRRYSVHMPGKVLQAWNHTDWIVYFFLCNNKPQTDAGYRYWLSNTLDETYSTYTLESQKKCGPHLCQNLWMQLTITAIRLINK